MLYIQAILLLIALGALGAVLIGAIKNVRGPRKGKYRTSWFEKK